LLDLWDDTQFTVLFVTHSIEEAIKIGNQILLLSPHPGQVRAELSSVARDCLLTDEARELESRIHNMLFAPETVAEVSHA
jgi:NitT/TauT family transport system ATP-binding protein